MTPAVLALRAAGVAFTTHEYAHDPRLQEKGQSFGLEAAELLGLDPDRVYKTLMAKADDHLVVAVVPVSGRLDLKALARAVGASKAAMADVREAERATGYVAGGISPFGQKRQHPTVVDETVELWDTVYVSGGRRGLDVEIAPADLVEVTGAIVADISRS
jgi:Cys-tRNA(Pro)/Cys-tRNA(Cys) deacylase